MTARRDSAAVRSPYELGERIEQVVALHARRRPDAIAVQQGECRLTYRALTRRALDLASALAADGVRPGAFVPTLIERSPELVVALLGIMHAGAAYVAMDPAWPRGRIEDVVSRSGGEHVLTDGRRVGGPDVRSLTLAELGGQASSAAARVPSRGDGREAACVFFTSGSTGRPKGVISPHRGTIRQLVNCPTIPLDESTCVLQEAPLPWDGLSLELWAPLLNGGRSVLLDRELGVLDVAACATRSTAGSTRCG
ncbi:MAG: hypothetical protein QOJ63_3730 [Solirubrobacteraceae bacterium]|jgi:non-ribosomal peptide synthetase component F|nr:hypothetical protein [Solirubrobacteraceae bacterium]